MNSQKKTLDFYNRNARVWSAKHTNSFHHEKQFRAFLRYLQPGAKVLDIGSAAGIHVPLFLGMGRTLKYEGVDASRSMVAIARARYPQLRFCTSSVVNLKKIFPARSFDGFWAAAILMHIPEDKWPMTLEGIESVLKPHGVGYVTLPTQRPNPESRRDRRHFTFFDDKKFARMVLPRKWRIVKKGVLDGTSTPGIWRWYIVRLP